MNILHLIERENELFSQDIQKNENKISKTVNSSRFLIIGGAGSIGQAVTKEIFKRNPIKLDVIDISENNLVELVRDIRSSYGYISGDFSTYCLDIGSKEYDVFWNTNGNYDYVLNLSALKHVRSEKDPYTMMRMIDVNIFNTVKTIQQSIQKGVKKYFCVSTDKAANPANMMGASKRIMEMFLVKYSKYIDISSARFANVAFSDGSLLHGFNQRIQKKQPIVAPSDIKRYFVTPKESGELCLMSTILGFNRDIFFPKLSKNLHLITFSEIAVRFLKQIGYEPYLCNNEKEARDLIHILPEKGKWPCLFTSSDTTGEKSIEEFYTEKELIDLERFDCLGIVKNDTFFDSDLLVHFTNSIDNMKRNGYWTKKELVELFFEMIPNFDYVEKGKYLDSKM